MQVFISRKKQSIGSSIDFKNAFHLKAFLVCSGEHTTMINEAIILRKTFEPSYFVIRLFSGAEILVSTDFLTLDIN